MKSSLQGGLIRLIILILIALVVLGYYGVSVRQAVTNPTTQDNVSYVWGGVVYVWDTYLEVPAAYLWSIFVNDLWDPAIRNLEAIDNNQPTDMQIHAPNVAPVDGNPPPGHPVLP